MKPFEITATRTGHKIMHTSPQGNRHASCGVVTVSVVSGPEAARRVADEGGRLCKNCLRVKPARDLDASPQSEPTDVWTVIDRAGREIARVEGVTMDDAREAAEALAVVREVARREGGYSLRRLRENEIIRVEEEETVDPATELMESQWSTEALASMLAAESGLNVTAVLNWGRAYAAVILVRYGVDLAEFNRRKS